jgi:hypothetical protein
MLPLWKSAFLAVSLAGAFLIFSTIASAQVATTSANQEKTLTLHNVTMSGNRLLGEITNNSDQKLRDISLMLQHSWRWQDGRDPKIEVPLKAVLFKLKKELLPGETATFTHPVPLPENTQKDGQFVTDVSVAAFSVVPSEQPVPSVAAAGSRGQQIAF